MNKSYITNISGTVKLNKIYKEIINNLSQSTPLSKYPDLFKQIYDYSQNQSQNIKLIDVLINKIAELVYLFKESDQTKNEKLTTYKRKINDLQKASDLFNKTEIQSFEKRSFLLEEKLLTQNRDIFNENGDLESENKILRENLRVLRDEYGKISSQLLKNLKEREIQERLLLTEHAESRRKNDLLVLDIENLKEKIEKKNLEFQNEIKNKNERIIKLIEEKEKLIMEKDYLSKNISKNEVNIEEKEKPKKNFEKNIEEKSELELLANLVVLLTKYKNNELAEEYCLIIEKYMRELNQISENKIILNYQSEKNYSNKLLKILKQKLEINALVRENLDEIQEKLKKIKSYDQFKENLEKMKDKIGNYDRIKDEIEQISNDISIYLPDSLENHDHCNKTIELLKSENNKYKNQLDISDNVYSNESFGQLPHESDISKESQSPNLQLLQLQAISIENLLNKLSE